LTDVLASRRCLYRRPVPTCADVVVLDIPPSFAAPTLSLGRYYPIIVETEAEAAELERFLSIDRIDLVTPDLLDRRPSALIASRITFCRYDPPQTGWPWLLLCHWPAAFTQMVDPQEDHFARSAYTIECFGSAAELEDMQVRLVSQLGQDHHVNIRFVSSRIGGAA
jgi:hypothetical protein